MDIICMYTYKIVSYIVYSFMKYIIYIVKTENGMHCFKAYCGVGGGDDDADDDDVILLPTCTIILTFTNRVLQVAY